MAKVHNKWTPSSVQPTCSHLRSVNCLAGLQVQKVQESHNRVVGSACPLVGLEEAQVPPSILPMHHTNGNEHQHAHFCAYTTHNTSF